MTIKEAKLKKYIYKTLVDTKKFKKFTSVQEEVIPLAISGKSLIGISQTGSGKSDAFLIPAMQCIDETKDELQVLIIAPTRELATQIFAKAQDYKQNNEKLIIKLMTGGTDKKRTIEKSSTIPHLIIGTPARLKDVLLDHALFNISKIKMFILDEIDMIFEMKYLNDIDAILSRLDKDVQTLAFSATLNEEIKTFVKKYMQSSEIIRISRKKKTASEVKHYAIEVNSSREETLEEVCKIINPYLCLVFASKKENVEHYYKFLAKKGFNVGILHGDLDSRVRRRTLKRIENNEFKFVVASDIAARGIDIEGISHVISIDLPNDLDFYFHRAGRTGRIGNEGESYCLYISKEKAALNKIEISGQIKFQYLTIKNGNFKEINEKTFKNDHRKESDVLKAKISKAKGMSKSKRVKPNHKKKVKLAVKKVIRDHKREIIKQNLKAKKKDKKGV